MAARLTARSAPSASNLRSYQNLPRLKKTELVLKEYGYNPPKRTVHRPLQSQNSNLVNGFASLPSSSNHVNLLQPRKGKKKAPRRRVDLGAGGGFGPPSNSQDAFSSGSLQPLGSGQNHAARMFADVHSAYPNVNGESSSMAMTGQKRKASNFDDDRAVRGRMMGSTSKTTGEVREIRAPRVQINSGKGSGERLLPVPGVQTVLRVQSPGADDGQIYLEARNSETARGKTVVTLSDDGENRWLDVLPSAVLAVHLTNQLAAVACENGSLVVYSPAGRR